MSGPTRMQRLAAHLLGCPLDTWVMERRREGLSWQRVVDELHETTDGVLDLNRETLRIWYRNDEEAQVS